MIFRRIGGWPRWGMGGAFEELERMRRQMDRLSEGLSDSFFREPAAGVFPLVNVTQDADSYYVRAELPGIKADELDISVTGNSLSITGERKIQAEDASVKYHRKERESGKFSRIINLPDLVDAEGVEARCADGVLTVVFPKAEAAKPKKIAIQSS